MSLAVASGATAETAPNVPIVGSPVGAAAELPVVA
jgi:hypothetical protein